MVKQVLRTDSRLRRVGLASNLDGASRRAGKSQLLRAAGKCRQFARDVFFSRSRTKLDRDREQVSVLHVHAMTLRADFETCHPNPDAFELAEDLQ